MYQHFLKRVLDLIFVVLVLPLWLLLFIVIGSMIYLEDKGTIFYNAPRLGKNGKIFKMYKFRSMKMNATDLRNKDQSTFNSEADPRVTKIGKFIRKLSIDETPQLLNILKNDMSLIGPRPDLPEHIKVYEGEEKRKLMVLPGITGYNQAYYRNGAQWKERLKNDVYYVDHLSLVLDIQVFFKTVARILLKKDVYAISNKKRKVLEIKLLGENFECHGLNWDTRYFGIQSARVNLTGKIEENDQNRVLDFCKNFEFTTISNLGNVKENNEWIGKKTNAFLTDMNLQFVKTLNKPSRSLGASTEVHHAYEGDEKVLHLGKTAYAYSRFFNDPRLPKQKAENIYMNWVKNAFGRKNKFFVISKKNNEIVGFNLFTIDHKNQFATIELIAVDQNYRGQRIGKALILAMESYIYKKGIETIKVGTQVDNISAVSFYTNLGFKVVSCGSVYHLWR